jgi:hypothetical protein
MIKLKLNLSLKILLVYLMVFYPLIFQIYLNNSFVSLINQFILFSLISLTIFIYSNRVISHIYSDKLNVSVIFLLTFFYLIISLTIFSALNGRINIPSILREFLYSIIPILFYLIGKILNYNEKNIFLRYIFYSLLTVVIIGFMYKFGLYLPDVMINVFEQKEFKFNFSSYYSQIIMGYFAQLIFALLLFKKIKVKLRYLLLFIFFITSILTLQRAAFLGLFFSLSIYLFNRFSFIKIIIVTFIVGFGFLSFYNALEKNPTFAENSRIFSTKLLLEEINQFSLSSVQSDRENQAVITNNDNFFHIIFGEGFGKYSPNNELALFIMPDASYFRIFNELGLIGFFLFFTPFIFLLYETIKIKDPFMVYFLVFSLVAFYFNRVLWAIPINYVFYTSLGIFSNFKKHKNE